MRRVIVSIVALASICLAQQNRQNAPVQQPPSAAPAAAAAPGAPAAPAAAPRGEALPPLNVLRGVDTDRYIGYPELAPMHEFHGTLMAHTILSGGDPYTPGANGQVLEYRKDLSAVTLLPHNVTPLTAHADAYFFYVESGKGKLDDGKNQWELRENIAVLVPPNLAYRFTNTGDETLQMVMLTWTATGTPKNELIVRDVNLLGFCEEHAHWNNYSKCIFGNADGLYQNERIYLVQLQPWSMNQPHSHGKGTEEIWVKTTPGTIPCVIGSDMREMRLNTAYLVPPDGITNHSNINTTKDTVQSWLYIARGAPVAPGAGRGGQPNAGANAPAGRGGAPGAAAAPGAPGAAGAPGAGGGQGGGRGPANPNINRDTTAATVAGKPLN